MFSVPGLIRVLTVIKDVFTDSNYRLFFGLALDVLVRPWERLVVTFRYNEVCIADVLCSAR